VHTRIINPSYPTRNGSQKGVNYVYQRVRAMLIRSLIINWVTSKYLVGFNLADHFIFRHLIANGCNKKTERGLITQHQLTRFNFS
jgi:cytoplasmic iron level regulating protein YaaA (DUF328/UPF0246 family)